MTRHVLIDLDGAFVAGLALKFRRGGNEILVTYELDGRVETQWHPVALVHAVPEASAPEPLPD